MLIHVIPHSDQNLSCLRSGLEYPRFIDDDTGEELFTPFLRQLNFWCECSVRVKSKSSHK